MFYFRIPIYFLVSAMITGSWLIGCQRKPALEEQRHPDEVIVPANEHQVRVETERYIATLTPENPPLTMKEERFQFEIKDKATGHPVSHEHLSARILMQTSVHQMQAPTAVHELSTPGIYEIETTFLMPGTWTIAVQREPAKEELALFKVEVEEKAEE